MAWTTPAPRATGYIITGADWNELVNDLRDRRGLDGVVTFENSLTVPGVNGSIELGALGASNTPFVDMHSGTVSVDYDVRMIASGGNGTSGNGVLAIEAANILASKAMQVGSVLTVLDRSTLRSGPGGAAGLWYETSGAVQRAFVGLLDAADQKLRVHSAFLAADIAVFDTGNGIVSFPYAMAGSGSVADAGHVRLANDAGSIQWRVQANNANRYLKLNTTDHLETNAVAFFATGGFEVNGNSGLTLKTNTGDITLQSFNEVVFKPAGVTFFHVRNAADGFHPDSDNVVSCGRAANRFSAVYAGNGTILTSDVTQKEGLVLISPQDALQAVESTDFYEYSLVDTPEIRGISFFAQEAHPLFSHDGLSAEAQRTASIVATALKAEVAARKALEGRLAALEARLLMN